MGAVDQECLTSSALLESTLFQTPSLGPEMYFAIQTDPLMKGQTPWSYNSKGFTALLFINSFIGWGGFFGIALLNTCKIQFRSKRLNLYGSSTLF